MSCWANCFLVSLWTFAFFSDTQAHSLLHSPHQKASSYHLSLPKDVVPIVAGDKHGIDSALAEIARCPFMVFRDLDPISIKEVRDWFNENNIYDSEQKRRRLAEELFGGAEVKSMEEVEMALRKIHKAFVDEKALERGYAL